MPVTAGGSLWEIAAAPAAQAGAFSSGIVALRTTTLSAWLLLSILLMLRFRQFASNQMLRAIIFRNERFLRAVETVSRVGGWRWAEGSFTEVSPQAREIMSLPADVTDIGMDQFCHVLDTQSRELVAA